MLLLKWIPSQVFLIEVWNIFKSTILQSLRVINIKRARTFPVDKFQFLLIFYKSSHQKKPCFWKRRVWAFHFLTWERFAVSSFWLRGVHTEAYSEPCQTCKMEHFVKRIHFFARHSILDVLQGYEYAYAIDGSNLG